MADTSLLDTLTVPSYRRGPGVLGLVVVGLLFLVPGFIAPIGLLQIVGALWLVAAAITAARDVNHLRSSTT